MKVPFISVSLKSIQVNLGFLGLITLVMEDLLRLFSLMVITSPGFS